MAVLGTEDCHCLALCEPAVGLYLRPGAAGSVSISRCTFVASLDRSCRALRQADVVAGRITAKREATMATSDPSTSAAQMRASIDGFIAGQGTTMLIGAVVVSAAVLWLTACVARLPPPQLTPQRAMWLPGAPHALNSLDTDPHSTATTAASARRATAAVRYACPASWSSSSVRRSTLAVLIVTDKRLQHLEGAAEDGCCCQTMLCLLAACLGWRVTSACVSC